MPNELRRIRPGDSLIGVFDYAMLQDGIPDAAYKPLTGDGKDAARAWARLNRAQRDGKAKDGMLAEIRPPSGLLDAARTIAAMAEDTLEQIAAKKTALDRLHAGHWLHLKTACDLYVAAFFAPKTEPPPGAVGLATATTPLTDHVWRAAGGSHQVHPPLTAKADGFAHAVHAFHWPLEFPDILARGGFDVVIGNPPWERVKLQQEEFFASRDTEIANAKNAAARKKMIAALPETNPVLAADWAAAVRAAESESRFLRLSGRYPLGGVGDVSTYAVFADLFRQLINPHGAAGLLLPNGLVTGFTYRTFLRHLLRSRTLASFYGFENEEKIFPDVHNETKFGVLTIIGANRPVDQPLFTAHIRQPDQAQDPQRRYSLTADQIEAINPNTLNLPAFRWAADAEVAAALAVGASSSHSADG